MRTRSFRIVKRVPLLHARKSNLVINIRLELPGIDAV